MKATLRALALTLLLIPAAWAATPAVQPRSSAIASAHPLATGAGIEVLAAGGNAFDAAVAVAAALAVVEPYSSGLGGGGFFLLHRASDGRELMLDARERAPLAARKDMYLDARGQPIPDASTRGPRAAGIPGLPAALAHLASDYGRLPLTQSLGPAIRLAEQGFAVDENYARFATEAHNELRAFRSTAQVFLHQGDAPKPEYRLQQRDLAKTLRRLADKGAAGGFYQGLTAGLLIEGVRKNGGIWQPEDLESYRVLAREPVRARVGQLEIVTAAPPSSAVILVEMLNILSGTPLKERAPAERVHVIAEVLRRGFRDRAVYLGDPDFVDMPLAMLVHPQYAAGLRATVHPARATPSILLPGVEPAAEEAHNTSHFSVLDTEGNRVAATLSINHLFGSGFVAPGTGVLLNNEMDDFSVKPGLANAFGLVGNQANAIAPGKRMLSSMSPAFFSDGTRLAILGTPGGSRILSMQLLAALNFAEGGKAADLVRQPRFHHQYLPDLIEFEPGALEEGVQTQLRSFGHALKPLAEPYGNMQAIVWDRQTGAVEAASDPRGIGTAMMVAPATPTPAAGELPQTVPGF